MNFIYFKLNVRPLLLKSFCNLVTFKYYWYTALLKVHYTVIFFEKKKCYYISTFLRSGLNVYVLLEDTSVNMLLCAMHSTTMLFCIRVVETVHLLMFALLVSLSHEMFHRNTAEG